MGWITNPKKAGYNWVYNRTTISWKKPEALVFILVAAVGVLAFKVIQAFFGFVGWLFRKLWSKSKVDAVEGMTGMGGKSETDFEPLPLTREETPMGKEEQEESESITPPSVNDVRRDWKLPKLEVFGNEIPDPVNIISLKDCMDLWSGVNATEKLTLILGKDEDGRLEMVSLPEINHLLVAGTTGSGKSVCFDVLISNLIFRNTPEELKLLLIDPSKIEFGVYEGLPHLALPIISSNHDAGLSFRWLVKEIQDRREKMAAAGVRDIAGYNKKALLDKANAFYQLVVFVSDLNRLLSEHLEESLSILAGEGHKFGVHIILSTPRPSVQVVAGFIKACIPARITFHLPAKVDSIAALGQAGAETLAGKGELILKTPFSGELRKIQGAYVSNDEVGRLVGFWKTQARPLHPTGMSALISRAPLIGESEDELYEEACGIVVRARQASTSLLQRRLKIGYGRAARLLDDMEVRGVVGPADGNKPRKILRPEKGGTGGVEADEEAMDERLD